MKTALVTGTTSGIGRVLVQALLDKDYEVIAHGRSDAKLQKELAAWTPKERVHTVLADLASKKDTARLADELGARFPKMEGGGVVSSPITVDIFSRC